MSPDLQALAEALDADPSDEAAAMALADWIEERRGWSQYLRDLVRLEGADLIVFSPPEYSSAEATRAMRECLRRLEEQLRAAGHNTIVALAPYGVTMRQCRLRAKGEVTDGASPNA